MSNDYKVRLRDQRKPGHGWFDNEIYDVFGDELGQHGISVYMTLARLCYGVTVKKDDGSPYGLRELAEHARMGKDSFARALKVVVALGLVKVSHGATSQSARYYDLMDAKALAARYVRAVVDKSRGAVVEDVARPVDAGEETVSVGDTATMPTLVELLSRRAGSANTAPSLVQDANCLTERQLEDDVENDGGDPALRHMCPSSETDVSHHEDTFNKTQDTRLNTSTTPQPPTSWGARPLRSETMKGRDKGKTRIPVAGNDKSKKSQGLPGDANDVACADCVAMDTAVAKVMRECNLSNARLARVIRAQMELQWNKVDGAARWDINSLAEHMIERQRQFVSEAFAMFNPPGMRKFFSEGFWIDRELWPYDQRKLAELRRSAQARIGMG